MAVYNSTFFFYLLWLLPTLSFLWKRRMVKGGSALSKRLRKQSLERLKAHRRRLKSFLQDELLKANMIRDFKKANMTDDQIANHLLELEFRANLPVTNDDVDLDPSRVLSAATVWANLGIVLYNLLLFILFFPNHTLYLAGGLSAMYVSLHAVDNYMTVGRRQMFCSPATLSSLPIDV